MVDGRRLKLLAAAGAVVLALMVPAADLSAAVADTLGPHAISTDICKTCHDTADGNPRLRGWREDIKIAAGSPWAKNVSNLCYTCHDSTGGFDTNASDMSLNAYATSSHGFVVTDVPPKPDGSPESGVPTSGLPYTNTPRNELE